MWKITRSDEIQVHDPLPRKGFTLKAKLRPDFMLSSGASFHAGQGIRNQRRWPSETRTNKGVRRMVFFLAIPIATAGEKRYFPHPDGASPSGKASLFGSDIPRFESWRPSQFLLISIPMWKLRGVNSL